MLHRKSWGHIVVIAILGLVVMCTTAGAQVFSPPKSISNNSIDSHGSFTPQIAVDFGGNIYVVWEDDTASNSNILFSRSTDGGATFLPTLTPTKVSNSLGCSFNPVMAVDASANINIVWQDSPDCRFRTSNIFFSRSTDGGINFSTPMNLSEKINSAFYSVPQIAANTADNISVVWESDTGNLGIWFSSSSDGGATFSAPKILSTTNPSGSIDPQIAVDKNGNINVVWEDDIAGHSDISFSRSTDGGATFLSTPKNLSNPLGNFIASSHSPRIAVDLSGNINVAWAGTDPIDFNTDIFFSRSTDNGANFFLTPKNVSKNTVLFGDSSSPQIAVDLAGNINVVWEAPDTNPDIFFARSSDGGATFSLTPKNLSNNSGFSSSPRLTVDAGGNINVAWENNTGNRDTFFKRSTDSGTSFSTIVNLSNDSGLSIAAQMAADKNGNVNVVWQDNTTGITPGITSGVSQILFSRLPAEAGANHPPVADAGADQIIECAGHGGTPVRLDGSKSSDPDRPDRDVLSFVWKDEAGNVVGTTDVVQLTLPLGTHTFTLKVTDPGGLSATATTHVTVRDTALPALRVTLSPDALWPPNHKLVQIAATVETSDSCDGNPGVALVSITSSEPDNGLGDGDEPDDIQAVGGGPIPFGTDVRLFLLRAERSGMGAGRIYSVNYMVRDASGNESLASAQVSVASHATEASLKHSGRKKQ